jgi:hypothetical protein
MNAAEVRSFFAIKLNPQAVYLKLLRQVQRIVLGAVVGGDPEKAALKGEISNRSFIRVIGFKYAMASATTKRHKESDTNDGSIFPSVHQRPPGELRPVELIIAGRTPAFQPLS